MFKSYEWIKYLEETNEYLYKIIDDDFEIEAVADARPVTGACSPISALIKAYLSKNYSIDEIGLNFALFNIYYLEKNKYWASQELIEHQDEYIPKYNKDIKNYKEIAEARNKHFKVLYNYS